MARNALSEAIGPTDAPDIVVGQDWQIAFVKGGNVFGSLEYVSVMRCIPLGGQGLHGSGCVWLR
jgi:hypothetical protein